MPHRSGPASSKLSRRTFLLATAAVTSIQMARTAHASALFGNAGKPDIAARLNAVAAEVDKARKALNIPGAALVIVKDDQVVLSQGFGMRTHGGTEAVTPQTLFAIGSDTKTFTAAAAVMSADAGMLSLDDSPRKFLPYFALRNPAANEQVTLRDLLSHRTGLMRSDVTWITGVLSREEAIRVAGQAVPTADFRTAFQYQNAMYMAAGEAIASAHDATWEQVIENRIFAPLGMKASTTSIDAMRRTANFAPGHDYSGSTPRLAPIVDRANVGGAGAIASNAEDMGRWLRLLLGRGAFEGKRLLSDAGFDAMTTQHVTVGSGGYGLGFFLGSREGIKTVYHGGNIDGFNSLVFLVPEHRIGFALLTNVMNSSLPKTVEDAVWTNLIAAAAPDAAPSDVEAQHEVGRYAMPGFYLDVTYKQNQLVVVVPNQAEAPMTGVGGRRYRWEPPFPAGFFLTFRPSSSRPGEAEALLEQPQGNATLFHVKAAQPGAGPSPAAREMIGTYDLSGTKVAIEARGDFVVIVVPGQPPFHLVEKEKDLFVLAELGDAYRVRPVRDGAGVLNGLALEQPEGKFQLRRVAGEAAAFDMTVDELMAKAVAAVGGEAALRKPKSMELFTAYEFENLGLTAEAQTTSLVPQTRTSLLTFIGAGKKIATMRVDCSGATSRVESSFAPAVQDGSCPSDLDYMSLLNWKTWWETVRIDRMAEVNSEKSYVVVKTAKDGAREVDFISANSFQLLRRDTEAVAGGTTHPVATEHFSDYRSVEGIMIPMRSDGRHVLLGRMVGQVKDVRYSDTLKLI